MTAHCAPFCAYVSSLSRNFRCRINRIWMLCNAQSTSPIMRIYYNSYMNCTIVQVLRHTHTIHIATVWRDAKNFLDTHTRARYKGFFALFDWFARFPFAFHLRLPHCFYAILSLLFLLSPETIRHTNTQNHGDTVKMLADYAHLHTFQLRLVCLFILYSLLPTKKCCIYLFGNVHKICATDDRDGWELFVRRYKHQQSNCKWSFCHLFSATLKFSEFHLFIFLARSLVGHSTKNNMCACECVQFVILPHITAMFFALKKKHVSNEP